METQEGRRPQDDGAPQNACRTDEKTAQPNDNPMRNAQVGGAFPAAIENQQLVADQSGFGYDRTQSTRSRQSAYGDDYMKKKGKDVAHAGWYQTSKAAQFRQSGNSPTTA